MKSNETPMAANLLTVFAAFGQSIEQSPDIVPAFANYNQDIGPNGGNNLGNLSLVNNERMVGPDNQPRIPLDDFDFRWYIEGQYKTDKPSPNMNDLKGDIGGVLLITLIIIHKPTSTLYERSEFGYFGYNDLPDNDLPDRPSQFAVFYDYYPEVDPRHYGKLISDLDGDGKVNALDLLSVLQNTQVVDAKKQPD